MKAVGLLFLAVVLTGCISSSPPPRGPAVAVTYYPHSESLVCMNGAPEPDFGAWDDTRMHQDLVRTGTADVDVLLVCIEPEDIRNRSRVLAYERFVKLASDYDRPAIAYAADCSNASAGEIRELVSWVANNDFSTRRGYFRWEGKPLLVLRQAEEAPGLTHQALTIRHTLEGSQWSWQYPKAPSELKLSNNGEQVMLVTGLLRNPIIGREGGWLVPRRDGNNLRAQFRAAIQLDPEIICVASWNDFRRGSFLEPNSHDGERPYLMLQAEIERLREIARLQDYLQQSR